MPPENRKRGGYVQVPTAELPTIRLRHLLSEEDSSIAVLRGAEIGAPSITGITEWVGTWQNLTVTVGWDWGAMQDFVVLLNPQEIRTSIQLVDAEGRAEPLMVARIHLVQWIESHPWRETAIQCLKNPRKDSD
ncbi:MAG TPA: DUF4902 domain-containing protein, partial [Steroidobacteraceae bacterium]|nr:DUF4902 domain-containing protein [Steroidobacteraceae bacterium]